MKITNPLEKELALTYKGDVYTISAGKTEDFTKEVANQWLHIYGFLTVDADAGKSKEKEEEPKKVAKKVTKKVADK